MRALLLLMSVLTGVVLPSCMQDHGSPDDAPAHGPDIPVRYHTEYLDIAPGFTQPICRGSLDDIDRYVKTVADLLRIDVHDRITLFWYNEDAAGALVDDAEVCSWCPVCRSCYTGVIHTNFRSLHHELVHAIVTPAWGWGDTLFAEGVAMGLDRIGTLLTVYNVMSDERPTEIVGSGQHGGSHFSRWLIDRYGVEKFSELFGLPLNSASSKAEVLAAVEEVYGLTLEELEAEYFATAPIVYPLPGFCDDLVDVPWNGDRWELQVTTDCNEPHVHGPSDDGGTFIVVSVDIPPELVGMSLATWIPSDTSAVVWPCIEEPLYDADLDIVKVNGISNNGPTRFRTAGRHRIELPVVESGEVYLRLCPDNGKFPGSYPTDKTVDPENCLGD
jgi:hypothetical protein